jgi:hypothetical protein
MNSILSINTHYSRPPHVKKCKIGYKYKKTKNICKRVIWPSQNTRNVKRCPKGFRRAKKTNKCLQHYYFKPSVIADYGPGSDYDDSN